MKPILISLLVIIFLMCSKERSCENCRELPTPDTIRTTPNELIFNCDVFIERESEVRKIYIEQRNKIHPNTYRIFDSILMDGSKRYIRSYDLKTYIHSLNDTFFVRTQIRWRFLPAEFGIEDTLVY
jgi:hypothetical protein